MVLVDVLADAVTKQLKLFQDLLRLLDHPLELRALVDSDEEVALDL